MYIFDAKSDEGIFWGIINIVKHIGSSNKCRNYVEERGHEVFDESKALSELKILKEDEAWDLTLEHVGSLISTDKQINDTLTEGITGQEADSSANLDLATKDNIVTSKGLVLKN